jgi:hypothetical protein
MIAPERVNRFGNVVPSFQIDDELAEEVLKHKWFMSGGGVYLTASIGGKAVLLHRFVWKIKHGKVPTKLDHINRDPLDNRLANLRPATSSLNNFNQSRRPTRLGFPRGVFCLGDQRARPYRAQVNFNGKKRTLGYFATSEEASAAHERARAERLAIEEQESEAQYQKEIAQ